MKHAAHLSVRQSQWFDYLREILEQEEVGSDLILGALSFTPDFALHVLALANTSTFASTTPIERLDRAVFLLGRQTIRDLSHDVPLIEVDMDGQHELIVWNDFVMESIAVATGASLIARAAQIPLVEEARTAGLIHDLGFDILARDNIEGLRQAWEAAGNTGTRLVDHERLFCSTDHCTVAEEVFSSLGLPDSLSISAGLHHDPLVAPSEHRYLTILIYAGECLARRAGLQNCVGDKPTLEDRVFSELRLDEQVKSSFVPLLLSELEKMGLAPRTTSIVRT